MPELSPHALQFLASHEAVVREAYRDQGGVWTWGVGLTAASGVDVETYIDRPVSTGECLKAFESVVKRVYWPEVRAAFEGVALTEHAWAAALSFHYNTGAINTATWVRMIRDGRWDEARTRFLDWKKPASILGRRTAEHQLFFDGVWPDSLDIALLDVRKPEYTPDPASIRKITLGDAFLGGAIGQ